MSSPLTLHGVVPLAWEWEAAGEGSSSAWQAVQKCAEKWSDEASYGECLSHLVFEILPSANTFAGCQDQPRVLGSTLHGVPLTVKHPGIELELASPCPAVASGWANWPARGGELRAGSRRQLPQLSCLTEVFSGEELFFCLAEESCPYMTEYSCSSGETWKAKFLNVCSSSGGPLPFSSLPPHLRVHHDLHGNRYYQHMPDGDFFFLPLFHKKQEGRRRQTWQR